MEDITKTNNDFLEFVIEIENGGAYTKRMVKVDG
jgi:hypothetical protein